MANLVAPPLENLEDSANLSNADSHGGVTLRVVFFSLITAVFFGFIDPIIDAKLANTFLGAQHLPPGAVGVLLVVLLIVNPFTRYASARLVFSQVMAAIALCCAGLAAFRWQKMVSGIAVDGVAIWTPAVIAALIIVCLLMGRRPLSRNETLVIYISCLISCLVPGHGAENFFIPCLMGPFYFATPENAWLTKFLEPYTPQWLTPALWADTGTAFGPNGKQLVTDWYSGNGGNIPWQFWIVPLLVWCSLIVAIYVMLGCLGVILRAQWAEHEALAFPLLRLPMELTEDMDQRRQIWRVQPFFAQSADVDWLFHCGLDSTAKWPQFLLSRCAKVPAGSGNRAVFKRAAVESNRLDADSNLSDCHRYHVFTNQRNVVFPVVFLLVRALSTYRRLLSWVLCPMPCRARWAVAAKRSSLISTSAFISLMRRWYSGRVRAHYGHVLKRAFNRAAKTEREGTEMLSYPVAFWGFVLSLGFCIGWSLMIGVSLPVALLMWLSYFVLAIGLTRVVVEGGLLFVQQGWTGLGTFAQLMNSGPGTWLPPNVLVPGAFLQHAIMHDFRGFLLPSYVQGFKLAHDQKLAKRPLLLLIIAVIAVTLPMGVLMRVKLGYDAGALGFHSWFATGGAQQPAFTSNTLMVSPNDMSWTNWGFMFAGMAFTWLMMAARSRFAWFPLHPLGYLVNLGYAMNTLWFSVFMGWLFKIVITRYGGVDSYRKVIPLFLGLALGDVSMMLFWLIIDGWQGRTYHYLVPT